QRWRSPPGGAVTASSASGPRRRTPRRRRGGSRTPTRPGPTTRMHGGDRIRTPSTRTPCTPGRRCPTARRHTPVPRVARNGYARPLSLLRPAAARPRALPAAHHRRCSRPRTGSRVDPHESDRALADDLYDALMAASPVEATLLGDRRFDARLPDVSPEGLAALRRELGRLTERLSRIDAATLPSEERVTADVAAH